VARSNGRTHDLEQIAAEDVELDLVAYPSGESLERLLGVVAGPVEAAIYEALDAAARRAEQGRHGERGSGDGEVVVAGDRVEKRAEYEDAER
jgi:hypothetical protein